MKLYTYWRSSAAYRVRIALNLKGVKAEQVSVDLTPGVDESAGSAFRAVNPAGRIPALDIGGTVLTQSLAIIDWLDEAHPDPPLLPDDPVERAEVRAFAQTIACDMHPLNNIRVLKFLSGPMRVPRETVLDTWYPEWVRDGFAALEETLRRRGGGWPYCFGGRVTLADVCLAPQMYNARRFDVDTGAYPRLEEIDAALRALPAFARAAPDAQPDAPKKEQKP